MKKQIVVSIEDSHMDRMPAMLDRLKEQGLEIQRSMPLLGVVAGAAEQDKFSLLRGIDGVNSVEEERGVDIGPPNSPIQ